MHSSAPAPRLEGKRVLLGVAGGIAAYKACDLASRLIKEKAQVTAVLTESAQEFVTALTFEALTGRPCLTQSFKRIKANETPYPHIDPAVEADLFLIAPATADLIARLAAGMADDLLSTLCLTARCPLILCPAMNVQMWEHPATQRNVRIVGGFGYRLLGPDAGALACGMTGSGRMVEPHEIIEVAVKAVHEPKHAPAHSKMPMLASTGKSPAGAKGLSSRKVRRTRRRPPKAAE